MCPDPHQNLAFQRRRTQRGGLSKTKSCRLGKEPPRLSRSGLSSLKSRLKLPSTAAHWRMPRSRIAAITESGPTPDRASDRRPWEERGESYHRGFCLYEKTFEGPETASLPDLSTQNGRRATHYPLTNFAVWDLWALRWNTAE